MLTDPSIDALVGGRSVPEVGGVLHDDVAEVSGALERGWETASTAVTLGIWHAWQIVCRTCS